MTDNVIDIRGVAPSADLKKLEWSEKRSRCEHWSILVWAREPILECRDCGAVVDPYVWIRQVILRWRSMQDAVQSRVDRLKAEEEALRKALRFLRKEYKDEAERREGERAIAVLPEHMRGRR